MWPTLYSSWLADRFVQRVGPESSHVGIGSMVRGVEVAVGLLGGGDLGDQVVEVLVQFRVGVQGQRVGWRLRSP